jgi:hypothetical protein
MNKNYYDCLSSESEFTLSDDDSDSIHYDLFCHNLYEDDDSDSSFYDYYDYYDYYYCCCEEPILEPEDDWEGEWSEVWELDSEDSRQQDLCYEYGEDVCSNVAEHWPTYEERYLPKMSVDFGKKCESVSMVWRPMQKDFPKLNAVA